jgi:hypothetical protein
MISLQGLLSRGPKLLASSSLVIGSTIATSFALYFEGPATHAGPGGIEEGDDRIDSLLDSLGEPLACSSANE